MSGMECENPDATRHWIVKKKTMYISVAILVVSTIGFAAIGFVNPAALESMGALIGWYYSIMSVPVVGFFGNSAVEALKKK